MVCGLSPSLRGGGLPGPDNGGQSGSSSGCSFPGCFRVPTRTLKKTVFRGRDSAGPLTEATRLYLSRAQTGEPFFIAGRAPRFYLYSADSGAGPSNGGLSRLWVSRRAARIYLYSADTGARRKVASLVQLHVDGRVTSVRITSRSYNLIWFTADYIGPGQLCSRGLHPRVVLRYHPYREGQRPQVLIGVVKRSS